MMERVSVRHGKHPTVLVAPHGYIGDDYNTDLIVDVLANKLDASAIINHGWQKSDKLDIPAEKANCNNTNHLVDEVADEFLMPFVRMVRRTVRTHKKCLVVLIHGVADSVRKIAGDTTLDMIIGCGDGHPMPSYTCPYGMKDYIIYNLAQRSIGAYEGKAKGRYSGFSKTNLNQYWRQHIIDMSVESIQVEIVRELRDDRTISTLTADYMAEAIDDALSNRYWKKPMTFSVRRI